TCLDCAFPIVLWWGSDLAILYNDEYGAILAAKHPGALGEHGSKVWAEIWDVVGPMLAHVMQQGEATRSRDLRLHIDRHGYLEEAYFSFSYSPIRGEGGKVEGIFCPVLETTEKVIGERRLRTLRDLAAQCRGADSDRATYASAAGVLAGNPLDIPFAMIYSVDTARSAASLEATAGIEAGAAAAPRIISLDTPESSDPWSLGAVAHSGEGVIMNIAPGDFEALPTGAWKLAPHSALVLPVLLPGQGQPRAILVAAVSPVRPLDEGYRTFFGLLATQIASGLADAQAREEERRRSEALAELDRAKTAFFSNVSHEFRTPLTLMLGPLEEVLASSHGLLPAEAAEALSVAHRNSRRLLRLVNTLLDFSRIEAGRVEASYEPTDLSLFTAELASVFRSAMEKAGLQLVVDCRPLPEPVYVDRDMWEKIVLNLLSNAFKFTAEGTIVVSLGWRPEGAELSVSDTGAGIPEEDMPKLFRRFHRVKETRSRTHEGTGIGLALVQELVRLHGGEVSVRSQVGRGTSFTIRIPAGATHLPKDRIRPSREPATTTPAATGFLEEALGWLPAAVLGGKPTPSGIVAELTDLPAEPSRGPTGGRILVADDNADMRDYLSRLLEGHYELEVVADGKLALDRIRASPPDLVLTDVMMPRLDGFGLLAAIRAEEATRTLPVIMLSARAGEESRIEGVSASANDYLIKPFSARELLARVGSQLELSRLRQDAAAVLRESEARFRQMADHAPVMIWVTEPDGSCTFLSKSWYEFTGQTPEEGLGLGWTEAVHPEDRQQARDTLAEASARHEPFRMEYRLRRRDGEYRWALDAAVPRLGSDGRFLGYIGSVIDISERRQAEERLRLQEAELREAQRVAHVGSWSWNLATGRMTGSPELFVIFGLDPARDAFPDFQEQDGVLFPHESWLTLQEAARATLRSGIDYDLDLPALRHGAPIWITARGEPVRNAAGEIVGLRGTVQDVTDMKQAQEALQEADRRKDEFLATLAHELRNPLAPIHNALQILRLPGAEGAGAERIYEMMSRQVSHMVRLVDDLMEVSRITRGKIEIRKEPVDLAAVVRTAVETSRPLIDAARHRLTIDLPPEPLVLEADLVRLAQVLTNLLNNAAKYTENEGRILLAARREGGQVVIAVRDNGRGIPAAMLPRVFDLFTQVEQRYSRSQGGLGIGLTLARSLVGLHGGTVEARSEGPGQGSEFIVRLPLAVKQIGSGGIEQRPLLPAAVAAHRILVVDDNRDAADSLGVLLESLGANVQTAHDGSSALAAVGTFQPSVVLLDIGMPGMDGFEVARRARQQQGGEGVTLIALSGWGQEEEQRRSREAGIDYHLIKPVDLAALEQLLASLPPKARW
ncbi:MAG TPA: ATP-binding protein, partial [Candidatus Polarisedimenticolia bacterium]|nr:ATP-binding protein [Candidatus Polarisedimenticolia bacterium]